MVRGSVSFSIDLSSGKKVVVKTLDKKVSTKQLSSFRKEVDAMRLLDHLNIIKYINLFKVNENSRITMEHVEGGNLQKLIENGVVDELV